MSEIRSVAEFERYQAERRTRWAKGGEHVDTEVDRAGQQPIKPMPLPRNKFGNTPTDGFDSKREAKRYAELRLREQAGEIRNLRTQVEYLLIPPQRDADGKTIERACTWTADFVYEEKGETVVEDAKGYPNDRWPIKRKLMLFVHGIRVRLV